MKWVVLLGWVFLCISQQGRLHTPTHTNTENEGGWVRPLEQSSLTEPPCTRLKFSTSLIKSTRPHTERVTQKVSSPRAKIESTKRGTGRGAV